MTYCLLLMTMLIGSVARVSSEPIDVSERPLNEQMQALRVELAEARLQVSEATAELQRIRQFLASSDLQGQYEQWKQQRQLWQDERRRLQRERYLLEVTRSELAEAQAHLKRLRHERAEQQTRQAEKARSAREPKWSIQYMLGFIHHSRQPVYVRVEDDGHADVYRRFYDDLDTRHVLVRGTMINQSLAPWRYTFEIRIGDEERVPGQTRPDVIGKWRYQTPLMQTGDLHEFEVKVPVSDARDVGRVQIGNIVADRPAAASVPDGTARNAPREASDGAANN